MQTFNATLLSLAVLAMITLGCEDKPPIAMEIADASVGKEVKPDAEPMPEVPQAAVDIFLNLPYPPKQLLRKPGDAFGNLRAQLPNLSQDPTFKRFYTDHRTEGPFSLIVYQLDKSERIIEAVSATFHEAYMHPKQYQRVQENMAEKLGKGSALREQNRTGRVWRTLDYRVELHIDKSAQDLVLLFHKRGYEDLKRLEQRQKR